MKKEKDNAAKSAQAETQAGKAEPAKAETKEEQISAEEMKKQLQDTQVKLKETEDELAKQKDIFLRTVAEYDNYRKRTAREKEATYTDATADAVQEFLSVEDNLERALEQKECSVEDLRKGVEMVQKQMQAALTKLGVAEMGKEGEPFDPSLHSAVAHIDDESLGENTIAKVFQKGYKIGDKVIRHAMVQAAN
ncbi:MAG TPA: nucleotide exchange factor GrpE [Caproicibacter sp.]|nr:nucleotide exchange factor GrpE [Caproicibacter sp.]